MSEQKKPIIPVKKTKFAPLSLRTEYDDDKGEKDSASLAWSVRMGYPRIEIYTSNKYSKNAQGQIDYGKIITAPFERKMFGVFMERFKEIIDGENDKKAKIDHKNNKFEKGVRTNEIVLQAVSLVGKDKNGIIYIAALEDGKRKVKFDLLPSEEWYTIYDIETGNPITDKAVLSKLYAKSYYNMIVKLMDGELVEEGMVVTEITPESKSNYNNQAYKYNKPETKKEETTSNKDDGKETGYELDDLI